MRYGMLSGIIALGMIVPTVGHAQSAMIEQPCALIQSRVATLDVAAADALKKAQDWPALCRYAADNAVITTRPDVVFIGDSLTEGWRKYDPGFFSAAFVNRGISGQTSTQILARFYQDVVALHPRIVHIIAGSNDVAGNGGPSSMTAFENNMRAMTDIAQANGIKVVIGSVLPADRLWWATELRPAQQLRLLNVWLRGFAKEKGFAFIDYYTPMSTPDGAMRAGISDDHVHPNTAGYAIMDPLALAVLKRGQ